MKLTCKECEEELEFTELDLTCGELIVKPCAVCLKEAEDACFEAGYDEGYQEGKEDATPK